MPDKIGPHLLGRRPSPLDPRDIPLSAYLLGTGLDKADLKGESTDPFLAAYAAMLKSRTALATKNMFTQLFIKEGYIPVNPPPPPPKNVAVVWSDPEAVLDQGNTPHCVGFGGAQWGNTLPIDDHYTADDGHAIYYECKVIDGEPKQEDGSDVRSLAKALQNRALLTSGPVVVGTDWMNDMFNPDKDGFVKPTGGVAGGHCYLWQGYDPTSKVLSFLNSWGDSWGVKGSFYMHQTDFEQLFADQGEAMAAVEVAH